MRARRLVLIAAASALAIAITVPLTVQAASVNTTLSGTFDPDTGDGTFSVDSGPLQQICSGGTTHDDGRVIKNTRQGIKILVLKSFSCTEGPTFVLQLSVLLDFEPTFSDTFSWTVMSGADGLEGLRGAGTGCGDDLGDHYAGRMTLR